MVMTAQKPGTDGRGNKWTEFHCPECGLSTVQRDTASVFCPKYTSHRKRGSVKMVK